MTFVSELKPTELWEHFDRILTIPRGSKKERQIADYVIGRARLAGLDYEEDETGNILVRKPGRQGLESSGTVILQSHLDMVNEKNSDVQHDFEKDPIRPVRDGAYLKADGTTLGSDNGIGVSASLAVMESEDIHHGPLEFLFTVDEETGLTGAAGLRPGFLDGTTLINLDTEEEGAFYVGCAGGSGVDLELTLEWEPVGPDQAAFEVRLSGLKGGHSGVDIHLQRANAIRLLARALRLIEPGTGLLLYGFQGGNMHNAIPREAVASFVVREADAESVKTKLETVFGKIRTEFGPAEPNFSGIVHPIKSPARVMTDRSSKTSLALLDSLPHGVVSYSYDIPELVETSSNLATAKIDGNILRIHVSNRSSVDSALEAQQIHVESIGRLAGASTRSLEGYPGWKPNLQSRILKVSQFVFEKVFGNEPIVKAVHAGLECGLIGEKYPKMDMVSIGPQIEFPHSPDERVKIDSVADFYILLAAILEEFASDV